MTALFIPLCLLAVSTQAEPAPLPKAQTSPGIILVQDTDGIPGRQSSRTGQQTLAMTHDRLIMIDHSSNQQFLMRLDMEPPEFYEVSTDGREYTRGKDYEQTQAQRDAWEEELRRNRLGKSNAEWEHALEKNFIRADGQRLVEVETKSAAPVSIEDTSFEVEEIIVRENGRVIVSALVTKQLGLDIPFFEFYRRLGAFSQQVLDKLKTIEGVPLQAEIMVVTSSFSHSLTSKVVRLRAGELELTRFDLPSGAVEVLDSPFVTCHKTGKKIERTRAFKHILTDGMTVWFADKQDWYRFAKDNSEKIKRDRGKPGGEHGPGGAKKPKPKG